MNWYLDPLKRSLEDSTSSLRARANDSQYKLISKDKVLSGSYETYAEYIAEIVNKIKNGDVVVASSLNLTSGISNEALVAATDLNATVQDLNTTINNLNAEKARLQEEIDRLNAEIRSESNNNDLEDQKNDLQNQKDALTADLNALKVQKTVLEYELSALNTDLVYLKEELKNINTSAEYQKVEQKINVKEQQINSKQAEIERQNNVIASKEKEIIAKENEIAELQKQLDEKQKTLTEKQTKLSELEKQLEAKDKEIEAKIAEIAALIEKMNEQNKTIADIQKAISELEDKKATLEAILYNRMNKLYNIYNRVDKLASIITPELKTMTPKEFANITFEEAKSLFEAQISKISNCEEKLTPFEKAYFINEYGIETITTKEVEKIIQNSDGTTTTIKEVEEQEIENPISKHFEEIAANTEEWNLSNYKVYLTKFREDDIYFSMAEYCYLTRLFTGLTNCFANEYADVEIDRLVFEGQSTTYLEEAKSNYAGIINSYKYNCSGTANRGLLFTYASRMVSAMSDINTYVNLYRLKSLNVNENLIEDIDKISQLVDLIKLYAYDNEIVDISNVDWASMTKLRILDIGFNGISNITPLENLVNIEELYLQDNLIAGSLEFDIAKFENLKTLDLSGNQIDDIEKLLYYLSYEARSYGYDDIASFLRSEILNIKFKNQQLSMKVDKKFELNENRKIDLPKIFRQIEEIDYANTSFAIDSLRGNVVNDGKQVLLDTTREGNLNAVVTITSTDTIPSLGSGTTCTINYKVGDIVPTTVTVTPTVSQVFTGGTQQFKAEVTGEDIKYTDVVWEVEGATSAETKISPEGLLTVAVDESAEKLIIRAISVYDETAKAEIEVTVIKKCISSMTVTPNEATVFKGESAEFTVAIEGENLTDADKLVEWEITPTLSEGTSATTKDNTLTINIDKNETAETFKVVAISKFDNTKTAEAIITVGERTVSEVIITPAQASVEQTKTQAFTATVNGENLRNEDKYVTYTIEGATSTETTITKDGVLTVGANENAEKLIVKATSVYDQTKSAQAEINVIKKLVNLGYEVDEEYVLGVATKTPVSEFKTKLTSDYTVVVKKDGRIITNGYMETGMYVEIKDENGNTVRENNGHLLVYQVIVRGDVNGDGVADSLDSRLIKAYRNEVTNLLSAQEKAADINSDGHINILDSKLLLYHRAEVKGYNLDYVK